MKRNLPVQYAVLFFTVYMHQHGLAGKYFFYWSNLLHFIFSTKLVVTFFVLNQDNLLFALMQKVTKTSRQTRLLRRFVVLGAYYRTRCLSS